MIIKRLNTERILNLLFSIFCFILIVDPRNTFFKLKDIVFIIIIILLSFSYKLKINKFVLFIFVYFIIIATLLRGILAGYTFDYEYTNIYLKSYTPLLLLCWVQKINILDKLTIPCLTVGIISLFIVFTMFYLPEIEHSIYLFMLNNDHFIIMSRRIFLGLNFVSVFYRTVPLAIMPCSIYCYKLLSEDEHKKKNFCIFIILALTLFFSGTRANILSVIFISSLFIILKIKGSSIGKIIFFFLFIMLGVLSILLLIKLLSENNEGSNLVKFSHLISYEILFNNNWDILLWGQGIGSLFYSFGFDRLTAQTEWTYIELIRYFGLIGGFFIIGIFFYPLFLVYKNRRHLKYALPFSVGYLFYLLIAGTNPLLTSSTGMLALTVAYSYAQSDSSFQT